ncbi:hypothetical protein [Streptomyces sp. NPDC002580]|uniref:hypothetical protein n=1 Tax=Streptomyces sp. NPDC002580 TaxID=3364653 RepID=UPI00369B1C50
MATRPGTGERAGWDVLRELSQRATTKLRQVPEQHTDWAHTGNLSEDIRSELDRQLTHHAREGQGSR